MIGIEEGLPEERPGGWIDLGSRGEVSLESEATVSPQRMTVEELLSDPHYGSLYRDEAYLLAYTSGTPFGEFAGDFGDTEETVKGALNRMALAQMKGVSPEVVYTSKVALAIKAMQNVAFARTMEIISPIVPVRPEVLDNFDFDRIAREGARNDGLPADWMVPAEKVAESREARAQAQAQAAQQQQALTMADAAGKVGRIKGDSALMQVLEQAGGQAQG